MGMKPKVILSGCRLGDFCIYRHLLSLIPRVQPDVMPCMCVNLCMYVCMYVCNVVLYACMHVPMCFCIRTVTHTYTVAHYGYIPVPLHLYTSKHLDICRSVFIHIETSICLCLDLYLYQCVYLIMSGFSHYLYP